jgi:hypothetical protein
MRGKNLYIGRLELLSGGKFLERNEVFEYLGVECIDIEFHSINDHLREGAPTVVMSMQRSVELKSTVPVPRVEALELID